MTDPLAAAISVLRSGWVFAVYLDALLLVSFAVPTIVRAAHVSYARAVPYVVGGSFALGVFSIVTGFYNGITDEPFAIPRYVTVLWAGHNPYTYPLVFDYTQIQFLAPPVTLHSDTTLVYLPLSMFVQVPFTGSFGYKGLSLAAWLATVYLLRRERWAVLVYGGPVPALVAANGFNDPIVLAFLTVAFVAPVAAPWRRIAEYVSLGMKQFAPFVAGVYYLFRRQWIRFALVVLVTFLFVLPFLLWGPFAEIFCSVFFVPPNACASGGSYGPGTVLVMHWNYYLWPVWLGALFGPRLYRWCRSPEGERHFRRARARLDARWAAHWRRLSQLWVMLAAYAAGYRAGFSPSAPIPPDSDPLPPDVGNPFADWSPTVPPRSPGR